MSLAVVVSEMRRRKAWSDAIRADLFDKQLALHDDKAQFKATHTGRRGGKSEGMPRSSVLDVLEAGPGDTVIIGAETLKKAKALHWGKIVELSARYKLPIRSDGNDSSWSTPWGSCLRFWGCTDAGAIELIRGFRVYGARFDEVASYSTKLPNLVENVLEPALGDTGGQLTLYGTPTFTRKGPWFDICVGSKKRKWSIHHWDARSNPFFRADRGGAVQWFDQILADNGWDWDNATFQREYLGLFVNDAEAQVYRYLAARNECMRPTNWHRDKWAHVVGIDFGVKDDCAWAAIGSAPHEKTTYVLESFKRDMMHLDEVVAITAEVCERYRPLRLVGDTGSLGAPYALEWNKRHAGKELLPGYTLPPMLHADKLGKRAHIDLVNTEFRQKRLLVVKETCTELVDELEALPWYDESRLQEHPAYANHCADAFLYACMNHFAYLNELPTPPTPRPALDSQARIDQEERELCRSDSEDWWDR